MDETRMTMELRPLHGGAYTQVVLKGPSRDDAIRAGLSPLTGRTGVLARSLTSHCAVCGRDRRGRVLGGGVGRGFSARFPAGTLISRGTRFEESRWRPR